jgi:hypothetical protein
MEEVQGREGAASILEEDVTGDGQGGLEVITPTPRGWHQQLDEAGDPTGESVCSACSTEAEREATADDRHDGTVMMAKVLNDASPGEGRPWEPLDFLDEVDPDDDDPGGVRAPK